MEDLVLTAQNYFSRILSADPRPTIQEVMEDYIYEYREDISENGRNNLIRIILKLVYDKKSLPSISDIGYEIQEHNREVLYAVATLATLSNHGDHILNDPIFDEMVEEEMCLIYEEFESGYFNSMGISSLYEIIMSFKMSLMVDMESMDFRHLFPEMPDEVDDIMYFSEKNDRQIMGYINDAQHILLPSIITSGISQQGLDILNIYPEYQNNQIKLG